MVRTTDTTATRRPRNSKTIARFLDRVKYAPHQFLSPQIILDACRAVGHRFRRGALDPFHTIMLFLAEVLSGALACSALRHLSPRAFTDSAKCQARRPRRGLSLAFFGHLLKPSRAHCSRPPTRSLAAASVTALSILALVTIGGETAATLSRLGK